MRRHQISFRALPELELLELVNGPHFRAARALLGWTIHDLARISNLSVSTIRRLEQSMHTVGARNQRVAVNTLRAGGIDFFALDDFTIAIAKKENFSALAIATTAADF